MAKTFLLSISALLAWAWLRASELETPQAVFQHYKSNEISTGQLKLLTRPRGYLLQFVSNGKTKQVAIPREWLVPPQEEKEEEEGAYVSSFNYDTQVQSFPIGNGRIGLHLSSYDFAREGTSHAAAGRDVFLVFDPMSLKIFQGGLRSGITKRAGAGGRLS